MILCSLICALSEDQLQIFRHLCLWDCALMIICPVLYTWSYKYYTQVFSVRFVNELAFIKHCYINGFIFVFSDLCVIKLRSKPVA